MSPKGLSVKHLAFGLKFSIVCREGKFVGDVPTFFIGQGLHSDQEGGGVYGGGDGGGGGVGRSGVVLEKIWWGGPPPPPPQTALSFSLHSSVDIMYVHFSCAANTVLCTGSPLHNFSTAY